MRRREFLATAMGTCTGLAETSPPPPLIRPFLNAENIGWLRSAYGDWRVQDRTGWDNEMTRHARACMMHGIHGNWLFLPWHRAFIYFHERKLAKLLNVPTFRLPVWHWEIDPGVPADFQPTFKSGNPLGAQHTRHDYKVVQTGVDSASVRAWLSSASWQTFCGDKDSKPDAAAGVHQAVHLGVGGDMGNSDYAAGDPLFFAHHANIDRYWAWWMENCPFDRGSPWYQEWLQQDIPELLDEDGQPCTLKVADVMDLSKLGYAYPPVTIPDAFPLVRQISSTSTSSLLTFPAEILNVFALNLPAPPRRLDAGVSAFAPQILSALQYPFLSLSGIVRASGVKPGVLYLLGLKIGSGTPDVLGVFGQFSIGHQHDGYSFSVPITAELLIRLASHGFGSVRVVFRTDNRHGIFGSRWTDVDGFNVNFNLPV